jgi:tRNA isopentenyl-2-thiomethyl-A-37 hydroxylase MiaE
MAEQELDAVVGPGSPPASAPAPSAAVEPAWKVSAREASRALRTAGFAAAAAAVLLALTLAVSPRIGSLFVVVMFVAAGLFVLAGIRSVIALARMGLADETVGAMPRIQNAAVVIGVAAMAAFGVFLAFMGTVGMSRGRQLRKRGKVLLPPLGPDGSWAGLPMKSEIPAEARAAAAARWRENGRTEHASVAAFARLTLDLMALGAPPDLIQSANLDARDEIRHAELCFSLAKALDGRDGGPGPFPEAQTARTLPSNRTLALAELAVDSLIDGALHEGLSARIIAQLAKRCEEPAIKSLLAELAADEGRHAAHGWDVVKWCLEEGGAPVAHALRGATATLPARPSTDLPAEARGGDWERFGIHGVALEEEQHRLSLAALTARVGTMTAGAAPVLV